jgi:hypothetical protein
MMDDGDKENIDAQFSRLDEKARHHRRKSIVQTIVLVVITGLLVLRLAGDIVEKQAQVHSAEQSRGELDKKLKSEQEKLDAAIRAREKLEDEIKDLEATKKSYQNRILGEKTNITATGTGTGKPPSNPESPDITPPDKQVGLDDAAIELPIIIEEVGKAPEGFSIKPTVFVEPSVGTSGRQIYKVLLALEVPEAHRANVERVSYHLSPKYYLKNTVDGGGAPNFEAKFNVFACESTVLGRVLLLVSTIRMADSKTRTGDRQS